MESFESEHFEEAEKILTNKKWEKKKRNILLYYLNKGTVLHKLGKYKESNTYFEKADYYIEDYRKNYALKAATFVSNPSIEPYAGENYEKVLLHYYATLNYIQLNELDEALVECKRMLITLQNINTFYKKNNKYNRDAFTHLLLGIIYDAKKDPNNAFIAYRNAYEIYKEDYQPILGTSIPLQLKKDILRTAAQNGFYSEIDFFEKEFGISYEKGNKENATLVSFWNNGLCPIKEENSITFVITNMGNGYVLFTNIELGITLPFYVGDKNQVNNLVGMKLLRVAFPKFVSRPPNYNQAYLKNGSEKYYYEVVENIDAIAHRSLKDRMLKELGETLLRFALKKLAEMEVSKNNQGLGVAVNILNTISEKADTRNWQMLPYSINYSRVPLKEGENKLSFHAIGTSGSKTDSTSIQVVSNSTYFRYFSSIK